MSCPTGWGWLCPAIGKIPGTAATGSIGPIVSWAAHAVVATETWVFGSAMTLWLNIPTPSVHSGPTMWLQQHTGWIVGWVGVLGLLIAATRLALERRATAAKLAARGLVNLAIVTGGTFAVITYGEGVGNAYSTWILTQALQANHHGTAQTQSIKDLLASSQGLTAGIQLASGIPELLIIAFALMGIFAGIAQIFLLVVRLAMLGLLAGLLPISAAASTTETGMAWFRKHCNWLLAYLLYKPVAATILAYGFVAMTSKDFPDQATGMAMFIMSVLALPSLMRLVNPLVTQATTRGDSGGAAAYAGTASGALGP